MVSRRLTYAILFSLAVHVLGASLISIIVPKEMLLRRPYTRVDFLGSILQKTAFDIMLEGARSDILPPGRLILPERSLRELEIENRKRDISIDPVERVYPVQEERQLRGFLMGKKARPGSLERPSGRSVTSYETAAAGRTVVYRPDPPVLQEERYGTRERLSLSVKVLIRPDGSVEKAEPVNTTGHVHADMKALTYVKSWIFQESSTSSWQQVEVELFKNGEKL